MKCDNLPSHRLAPIEACGARLKISIRDGLGLTCSRQIDVLLDFVVLNHFPSSAVAEVVNHLWAVSASSPFEAELLVR